MEATLVFVLSLLRIFSSNESVGLITCSPFGTTPEEIVPKKIVDTCSVKKRNYYVCVCFF